MRLFSQGGLLQTTERRPKCEVISAAAVDLQRFWSKLPCWGQSDGPTGVEVAPCTVSTVAQSEPRTCDRVAVILCDQTPATHSAIPLRIRDIDKGCVDWVSSCACIPTPIEVRSLDRSLSKSLTRGGRHGRVWRRAESLRPPVAVRAVFTVSNAGVEHKANDRRQRQ